jgi:hypothetical protein
VSTRRKKYSTTISKANNNYRMHDWYIFTSIQSRLCPLDCYCLSISLELTTFPLKTTKQFVTSDTMAVETSMAVEMSDTMVVDAIASVTCQIELLLT